MSRFTFWIKQCSKAENSTHVDPHSSNVSELKRENSEHNYGAQEEEVELQVGVYDEIKVIARERGYSFEKIVESALKGYIERYRKSNKR